MESKCPVCGAITVFDENGAEYCSEIDECGWEEEIEEDDLDEEEED